jgi:hypothetical protein
LLVEPVVVRSRWLSNGVIAVTLATFAVSLPPLGAAHGTLRERARASLGALGVRPPEWRLFAPNVHKTNTVLVADITLADGAVRQFRSPDFRGRSPLLRFREGQLPKFWDNLRRDRNRSAWRPFAHWVARHAAPGEHVTGVRLERRVSEVAAPTADVEGASKPSTTRHVFYERWFR